MGWARATSPYLADDNRLADVIAAIQTMGAHPLYKQDFAEWSDRICGDESRAEYWRKVFIEHPEFFRVDSTKEYVSLVLRRQRPKVVNIDDGTTCTYAQFRALPREKQDRYNRPSLNADELEALIDVAINLHARATERARDRRALVPSVLAFLGAVAGTLLTLWLK
jgi:hypothetical protein